MWRGCAAYGGVTDGVLAHKPVHPAGRGGHRWVVVAKERQVAWFPDLGDLFAALHLQTVVIFTNVGEAEHWRCER